MNLYQEIMDATDTKFASRFHNLAKGAELRGNMYLVNRIHELMSVAEDIWNAADIALEDEHRYSTHRDNDS
jgi:hypothetical protein